MQTTGQIDANKVIFRKVFSEDFWFVIPEYQRSYVWQTDHVTELVEDLYFAFQHKPESEYFLGSLVLKRVPDKDYPEYEVLDGQQRLTTFFIMMAVLRDIIDDAELTTIIHRKIYQEANRLERIPARKRIVYKIRDKVEDFVDQFLINKDGTGKIADIRAYVDSDNVSLANMSNAILVLRNSLQQKLQAGDLEDFIIYIFNNALFIYVSTDNTVDAFRLFTILNDRGIPLTNADILKAQNIGALSSEREIEKYAEAWEEIESKHGENFDRFLQFIRTILVKEKSRASLLEEFNEKIYNARPPHKPKLKPGRDTLELINEYSSIHDELIELNDCHLSNEYKNLITVMKIGMRSDDWVPPLMYYRYRFGTDRIEEFLKKLEYKFTGDWVCGVTRATRIESMNRILRAIEVADDVDALLNNRSLFSIDTVEFKRSISGNVYKKQYCRYLLLKLEYLKSDNTVHLSNYNYITVEHILPQNPPRDSQWRRGFTDDQREFWTNKLANLVLISKRKNSSLSNRDFRDKKEMYLKGRVDAFNFSKVFIQQHNEWTPEVLQERQNELLNLLMQPV